MVNFSILPCGTKLLILSRRPAWVCPLSLEKWNPGSTGPVLWKGNRKEANVYWNLPCAGFLGRVFLFCHFNFSRHPGPKPLIDPVYVCCNLKRSWYAVVIKEESGAVYPAEEYQSSKLESPSGPSRQTVRALCCSPKAAPKCKAKISATESAPCAPGADKISELCLYEKSKGLLPLYEYVLWNLFFRGLLHSKI